MNLEEVEKVAEAVLYEGYMLDPYRPSSVKNQQRWNFGALYPPSWCDAQSGWDRCRMRTECLVQTGNTTRLTVKVRFLQIVQRSVGKLRQPVVYLPPGEVPEFDVVDRLELVGNVYQRWQEAVERVLLYEELDPADISSRSPAPFSFPEGKSFEFLRDEEGGIAGVLVREREALIGLVEIRWESCPGGIVKVTVGVENLTVCDASAPYEPACRESVIRRSLVSAHTILGAENGKFISLLDPPADLKSLVTGCENVGTWPVLAGDDAEAMLSSPIILYDHPHIAPESAGNLFDSTEIDEILSLRILTLSDEEKREMRQSDEHARGILERTESMPEEQFMKLHGVLRGLTPVGEEKQ